MKRLLLILFIVFLAGWVRVSAQGSISLEDKPFVVDTVKDMVLIQWLRQQSSFSGLSNQEQEMAYWVNLMRKDPPGFWDRYIEPFLTQFPQANGNDAGSLETAINNNTSLPLLKTSPLLAQSSKVHAEDLVYKQKRMSHRSSDGKSFEDRMHDYGITRCAGENIYEGKNDPLRALILLLIDKGVPGNGHRKALLNPGFNLFGCSILPFGNHILMVQDFSCEP